MEVEKNSKNVAEEKESSINISNAFELKPHSKNVRLEFFMNSPLDNVAEN